MGDVNAFIQQNQVLVVVGLGFLAVWFFFPGFFKQVDKGRKAPSTAAALATQVNEIANEKAAERIIDTITDARVHSIVNSWNEAIVRNPNMPNPPSPTPAGQAPQP